MKPTWILDYDMHTDKCYNRPGCPECDAPVGKYEDGKYRCYSCGKEAEITDPDMIKWFQDREGEKVEYEDCPQYEIEGTIYGCGGKGTTETHYYKNPVTLKWQVGWGQCNRCGKRFIV